MRNNLLLFILLFLLTACSSGSVETINTVVNTSTPTQTITRTLRPSLTLTPPLTHTKTLQASKTLTATSTRTPQTTPTPQLTLTSTRQLLPFQATYAAARSTLDAFVNPCKENETALNYDFEDQRISPDGKWIAITCYGAKLHSSSYLYVISRHGEESWRIDYKDYMGELGFSRIEMIYPIYWSKDGKYLFTFSPSGWDGCCWYGSSLLMIRLNLETGQQAIIANYAKDESPWVPGIDFSISPSERYVLYIPQGIGNLYILDMYNWKQEVIPIVYEHVGAGSSLWSANEKKAIIMLIEKIENNQGEYYPVSVLVVDLESGSQKKFLSVWDYMEDTPRTVKWVDEDHVLLREGLEYWLMNIHTGELTEAESPN